MSIKIIRTSAEHKAQQEEVFRDLGCPECGNLALNHCEEKVHGFFKKTKVFTCTCAKCGCQWERRD